MPILCAYFVWYIRPCAKLWMLSKSKRKRLPVLPVHLISLTLSTPLSSRIPLRLPPIALVPHSLRDLDEASDIAPRH
jgi:hypothetical protein